jgi:hypothetical protein
MTLSTKVLGGVASLALLSALAQTSSAQSLSQSSPEEMAQTQTLNDEELVMSGMIDQADMVIAANDVSNQSAYSQAQMQFNDAAARYHQQLDEYNRELQDYQAKDQMFQQQASNFDAAKSDYNADLNAAPPVAIPAAPPDVVVETPPDVVVETKAPNVVIGNPQVVQQGATLGSPEVTTLVHLRSLADPDNQLAGTPVEDRNGRAIGRFNHMTFVDEGLPKGLIILDRNNKMVAVPEEDLRFDQDHAVVVADLSLDELNRLPGRL